MTTIEHRQAAILAILADATGPLTPREVAGRMTALGHDVPFQAATRYLDRLAATGHADRIRLGSPGCAPIYWATSAGRLRAASLEAQRIEGV